VNEPMRRGYPNSRRGRQRKINVVVHAAISYLGTSLQATCILGGAAGPERRGDAAQPAMHMPLLRRTLEFFGAELAGALFATASPVPHHCPALFLLGKHGKARTQSLQCKARLAHHFPPLREISPIFTNSRLIDVRAAAPPAFGGRGRRCAFSNSLLASSAGTSTNLYFWTRRSTNKEQCTVP